MLSDYLYGGGGVRSIKDQFGATIGTQVPSVHAKTYEVGGDMHDDPGQGGGYMPGDDPGGAPPPPAPGEGGGWTPAGGDGGPEFPSYPIDQYVPGQYGGGGQFDPGDAPGFDPGPGFDAPEFHAPDVNAMENDPAYQFRLNQGLSAMQRSAAAKGVLQTGGTLHDLEDYGQAAASQEYANSYNRALQTWHDTQYAPALAEYDSRYTGLRDEYQSQYDPWLAEGNWGQQANLQGNQIDFQAYQAWVNAQLARQGLLNNAVFNQTGQ